VERERERGARQRERCGWGARTLVEREIGKGKGGKKKQKKRKQEKKRKNGENYFIQFKSTTTTI